jgi:hypothetical protein
MIARLVGSHLEQPGPTALFTLFLFGVPAFIAPTPAIALAVMMVWRLVPPRPTAFEAALPVRGREVVMSRAIATLALMALPMAGSLGLPRLHPVVSLMLDRRIASLLAVWALGVVATLLPYLIYGGSIRPPSRVRRVLAWGALAVVGTSSYYIPPATAAWLLTFGAVAAIAVLWRSTPDALQLAPCRPERSEGPAFASREAAPSLRSGRHLLTGARWALVALRSIVTWRVAIFYPLLVVSTLFGSSGMLMMFCLVTVSAYATTRMTTRWLAALPLTDRTRLLAVVLPSVVVSTLCVGLGSVIPAPMPRYENMLTRDAPSTSTPGHWYSSPTKVSLDHWRRAEGASPPVIIAPWGERAVADTATVLGRTLYNPFTSPEHASSRFIAWQFARATTEVYGRPLTQAQYDTMSSYPPRLDGGPRAWLVNAAALLSFALVIALLSEFGFSRRLRQGTMRARLAPWLSVIPITAVIAPQLLLRVRDADVSGSLLHGALLALANELPANPVLALVVAAGPVAAMYVLLEWQFRHSELSMVTKPTPSS